MTQIKFYPRNEAHMTMNEKQPLPQRFGAASIIGLPNAGKSTLTNELVGAKVSIVTRKRQTTRSRVTGIMVHDTAQVILIDTPGLFRGKSDLEKSMARTVQSALEDTNVILHVVDSQRNPDDQKEIIEKLPRGTPCILVLNKVDLIKKSKLMDITAALNAMYSYQATYMIAALSGNGVSDLKNDIITHIPEGAWRYDEDDISTQTMVFMAAEITRETIYETVHDEIPYAVHIETEDWENFDNGSVKISQIVYVERDMHKAIILGKAGQKIKDIGKISREKMKESFGCTVHLKLFVKVSPNWTQNRDILAQIENA